MGVQGGVGHAVMSVNGRRATKGVDSPPPRVGAAPPLARCPRAKTGATVSAVPETSPPRRELRPEIQGLRAVAVLFARSLWPYLDRRVDRLVRGA